MAGVGKSGNKSPYKTIWGFAKSLALEKNDLYALIYRETGKEHMTDLLPEEVRRVEGVLYRMLTGTPVNKRRTDEGGNPKTAKMRRKIYMLTKELGWNDDNNRINSFCKKIHKVDRLEWLSISQCSTVIEALKDMVKRQEGQRDEDAAETAK